MLAEGGGDGEGDGDGDGDGDGEGDKDAADGEEKAVNNDCCRLKPEGPGEMGVGGTSMEL